METPSERATFWFICFQKLYRMPILHLRDHPDYGSITKLDSIENDKNSLKIVNFKILVEWHSMNALVLQRSGQLK